MQFAKDSVYVAFRDRLASVNPERVIVIDGLSRPAVVVAENQSVSLESGATVIRNAFELRWGAAEVVRQARVSGRPLMQLELQISYSVTGVSSTGNDRGRTLGAMDMELLQMCTPRRTTKQDYTQATPVPLGSMVFWSDPQLSEVKDEAGVLKRSALLAVFYFPEGEVA